MCGDLLTHLHFLSFPRPHNIYNVDLKQDTLTYIVHIEHRESFPVQERDLGISGAPTYNSLHRSRSPRRLVSAAAAAAAAASDVIACCATRSMIYKQQS